MDSSIFFGGSLVAAVVAGMIALFAPCCISVMLTAYFASSFQNRGLLVAMTFLFGAGVATVILPIAMGAAILRRIITTQHTVIYVVGGSFMIGLAIFLVLGGKIHLPSPGHRTGGKSGPLSVYSLGIFSGIASSCCAPVLGGLIALSGIASSFVVAVGLGVAYVFGIVAPLFAIALLWDRFDWRASRVFRPRTLAWHIGTFRRTLSATDLASALLLGIMGALAIWIGFTGDSGPMLAGWQANLAVRLQEIGQRITTSLLWLPGWAAALALVLAIALLARRAFRQLGDSGATDTQSLGAPDQGAQKEEILEQTRA